MRRYVFAYACLFLAAQFKAAEVRVTDAFAGTLAQWEADEFNWQLVDGRLSGDLGLPATACLAGSPLYATVQCEVTLVPTAASSQAWKLAGIGLLLDEGNFWHLALAEKPDTDCKGHFVELCEMRDGKWLAQENLKRTTGDGLAVDWQYGQAYRLRLALTPRGIDGWVFAADGQQLTHIAYEFTATAIKEGRPMLKVSGLRGSFDDFSMTADDRGARPVPVVAAVPPPAYAVAGSGVKATTAANGYFQVEKDGERWWLVDPRGERFYAVGTDHVNYYSHWCQKLGYAPYNRNCERLYGSPEKWGEMATQRLRAWGFNLLGAGNIEQTRYQGLAHTLFAAFGSTFSDVSALVEKTTWTGFPNVFDPRWEAYCNARAKITCAANRTDPWLLGYFLDNELEWYGKAGREEGIWIDTMKRPATHTGKRALVDRLKAAQPTLAAFNETWGQKAATWDDVLALTDLPALNDASRALQKAFLAEVAERYFAVSAAAIRKADPNHLVIGSRFAGDAPEWAWKACARHCDVVTFNNYPRIDFAGGDLSELAAVFSTYYGMVERPMMITEWSFPALDAGLPSQHGAGMRVDTQEQKAQCYEVMQHLLFRLPFMVGSDYFMWQDEPALGISDTFPEDSNYGLVNEEDTPWPELTAMATRLNPLAFRLHSGEIPEVYLTKLTYDAKGLEVRLQNLGSAVATAEVRITLGQEVITAPKITLAANAEGTIQIGREFAPALAPGVQPVTAEIVVPPGWAPRGCRGVTRLTAYGYGGDGQAGQPTVVVNGGAVALPAMPALLPWPAAAATALRCGDLPLLPFAEGMWVLRAPPLAAAGAFAGVVQAGTGTATGKVRVERLGEKGYAIDNGVLRLEHDGTSGNIIDRIAVNGILLGRYNPLVWQRPGGDNQWVQAESLAAIDIQEFAGGVVVSVSGRHGGTGGVITAVDDQGKMASQRGAAVPFEVEHRFVVLPDLPFIVARCVAVKNVDPAQPLVVMGVFHYLLSSPGSSTDVDLPGAGKNVPNYYRTSGAGSWYDAKAGTRYGCVPLDERIQAHFWLDPGGAQHPDARLALETPAELAPGEVYRPDGCPAVLIYGAVDKEGSPAAWSAVQAAVDGALQRRIITPTAVATKP
jgi:agarase